MGKSPLDLCVLFTQEKVGGERIKGRNERKGRKMRVRKGREERRKVGGGDYGGESERETRNV